MREKGIDVNVTWLEQPEEPPGSDDGRVQLLTALPQPPVRGHHQAALVAAPRLGDHADDRVITGTRRGHQPHRPGARSLGGRPVRRERRILLLERRHGIPGSALEHEHPGVRRPVAAPGEHDHLAAQAQRRGCPIPPPTVGTGTHHVGHVDHYYGRGGCDAESPPNVRRTTLTV